MEKSVSRKNIDDYSVDYLMQFEKGKTPLEWLQYVVALGYISDPNDPGAIGWMRRFYKALLATRDQINELRRVAPNALGVTEFVQYFEKSFPVLAEENVSEQEKLKKLALIFIDYYKDTFKDARTAIEKSEHFLDNKKLIPPDKHATLEQIRTMSFREASRLIAAKPLVDKWENEYFFNKTQTSIAKPERKVAPRVPKQLKRLNEWKAAWRKVKGRWKGGSNYQELAQLANVSPETIADIVKAGDAGLLD